MAPCQLSRHRLDFWVISLFVSLFSFAISSISFAKFFFMKATTGRANQLFRNNHQRSALPLSLSVATERTVPMINIGDCLLCVFSLDSIRLAACSDWASGEAPIIETGVLFDLYFTPTSHQMGNTLSCRSPSLLVSSNRRELLHHHPRH